MTSLLNALKWTPTSSTLLAEAEQSLLTLAFPKHTILHSLVSHPPHLSRPYKNDVFQISTTVIYPSFVQKSDVIHHISSATSSSPILPNTLASNYIQCQHTGDSPRSLLHGLSGRSNEAVVFAHGYGSGTGLWFRNLGPLADALKSEIIAFDWLGMGRSSRPQFRKTGFFLANTMDHTMGTGTGTDVATISSSMNNATPSAVGGAVGTSLPTSYCNRIQHQTAESAVQSAQDFFIDSLELWRQEMNIDKMALLGHSLGGYLSCLYALKYPERVSKLIMCSPVGIPQLPLSAKESSTTEASQALPFPLRIIDLAWKSNVTPQGIVRLLGPYGPKMVESAIISRFRTTGLSENESRRLASYVYHISAAEASGEYAMNALLTPVLFSHSTLSSRRTSRRHIQATGHHTSHRQNMDQPQVDKMQTVQRSASAGVYARQALEGRMQKLQCPVWVMFGDRDWMYNSRIPEILESIKKCGVPPCEMNIVPNGGHHLYMDNAEYFNDYVVSKFHRT